MILDATGQVMRKAGKLNGRLAEHDAITYERV